MRTPFGFDVGGRTLSPMSGCCYPDEYGRVFTAREAARTARAYLSHGLKGTACQLADAVESRRLEGAAVLEAGGGVGTLTIELLRRGARRGTIVDLSPSWEEAAAEVANAGGVADRIERVQGDIVDLADTLERADIVIAHRVICCYPEWRALLDTLAARSGRIVAVTVPVDRWWTRLGFGTANRTLALVGRRFRIFVHPVAAIIERCDSVGFRPVFDRSGPVWRTILFERSPSLG